VLHCRGRCRRRLGHGIVGCCVEVLLFTCFARDVYFGLTRSPVKVKTRLPVRVMGGGGSLHTILLCTLPFVYGINTGGGRRGVEYCAIVVQSYCNRVGNAGGGGQ